MDVTSSSGQVSWLAGRCFCPAFPARNVPVAWGTAARRLQLRGQRRNGWLPIAPASLFASSSRTIRKNPDGRKVARRRRRCQRRRAGYRRNWTRAWNPCRMRRVQVPFTAGHVGQGWYFMALILLESPCPCLPVLLQQPAIAAKESRFHAPRRSGRRPCRPLHAARRSRAHFRAHGIR